MADPLSGTSFAGHEGSRVTVHVGDETVDLDLVDVTEHDYGNQESVSVLFRGSRDRVFEHGTYRIEHDELGTHDVALGPVLTGEEDDDEQHFEATFSRKKT